MKTEAFLVARAKDLGAEVIAELASIYPKGLVEGSSVGDRFVDAKFECRLPWGGDLIKRLMECLADHDIHTRRRGQPSTDRYRYHLDIERTYSRLDFEKSVHLKFSAKSLVLGVKRAPDGIIELKSQELRSGMDIGSSTAPWVVVSDRVKQLIEGATMTHIAFRETRIVGNEGQPARRRPDEFWELTSDLILPPMGSPCKFIDARTEEEVAGDFEGPFVLREALEPPELHYSPPEAHYDEEALREVGSFDLALTFEKFVGGYLGGPLICSPRFYRFCVANGLSNKLYWTPVRINPAAGS